MYGDKDIFNSKMLDKIHDCLVPMNPEDPFAVAMYASDEYFLFIWCHRIGRDTPWRRVRECYKKEIKNEDAEETERSEA
jgi:hypothetical protein